MEILKYLDVLIGLAVVMVLLSPLVAAITQFWMWFTNTRAGRLQVGLKSLLLQLDVNPYDKFDAALVTGLPAGTRLAGDGFPPDPGKPGEPGSTVFMDNIPGRLKAGKGVLTFAPALPVGTVVALRCGFRIGNWSITTPATDATGAATVHYNYPGPPQVASRKAIATTPAGSTLTVRIASGPFKDTPLTVSAAAATITVEYPANIEPVPQSHDLQIDLHLGGAPLVNQTVTLEFQRNAAFDTTMPPALPEPISLLPAQAEEIAKEALLHPMVAQPPFLGKLRIKSSMRGDVIEREELIRILLEFAAAQGAGGKGLSAATLTALRQVLAANDITDPGNALAMIRDKAQQLELKEPNLAAHVRQTQAIVSAAPSSFVGKINNWFDQVMDRTTAEYKFRAQLVTVFGAFLVALSVQMDSLDLLKRLSTDDKLRASLVERAQNQQKRLDDQANAPADKQNKTELDLARARREEIEANLAALREPQLGVLPDHFLWDKLPQARLIDNSGWSHPYSERLELVVGTTSYQLEPQWLSQPLDDIRTAIKSSGAPVTMELRKGKQTIVKGTGVGRLQLKTDGVDHLMHVGGFAQAELKPGIEPKPGDVLYLLVGHDPPVKIAVAPDGNWADMIKKSGAAVSLSGRTFKATKRKARWIELHEQNDPDNNLLGAVQFLDGAASFDELLFHGAENCEIAADAPPTFTAKVDCDTDSVVDKLQKAPELSALNLVIDSKRVDHLVLVSRRLGPLQLRSIPGKPDSNMLNRAEETAPWDWGILKESWRGMLLTWVLLSLGAPFWYEALKDLLKLRSSLAQKEEQARNDRQNKT
jgi:hypothetical protein